MWNLIAKLLARPAIANRLICIAMKTPYLHIEKDGDVYMERYWLFNSYQRGPEQQERSKYPGCPFKIRIHWIRRADEDRHLHDRPWNARTFILRGGYVEQRVDGESICRPAGATARLNFGEFHRITQVMPNGAWTLFISGPYQGSWGFLVDGVKVKWREYLGLDQ